MSRIWMALIFAPFILVMGCADLPAAEKPEGKLKCVVAPTSYCTRDLNECGNASRCGCDEGYNYNSALGKCVIDMGYARENSRAISRKPVQLDSPCAMRPTGGCTRDINSCGNPSKCGCEDGYRWNAAARLCVKIIDR